MAQKYFTHIPFLIAALLPALTFHEWAHAMVAHRFGDNTAKQQGRLTLNPFAHLDPFGTLMILFVGFGWAKPVPIDPRNFKSTWAEFFVASAGPAMNILLASVFAFLLKMGAEVWFGEAQNVFVANVLYASIELNLALAIFNLIPIGPLDGSHIFSRLLPLQTSLRFSQWNATYGSMILFGIVIIDSLTHVGILGRLIFGPVKLMERLLLG
jgi:Zn-dependent protease